MLHLLGKIDSLLDFHLIRNLPVALILLIIIDAVWRKKDFVFSYTVIRFSLLLNWGLQLVLIFTSLDRFLQFAQRGTGPYLLIYWILFIGTFILPIFLLHKKMGKK